MSNLGSESKVLDLETGKGSDPGTASASASASSASANVERAVAAEDEDPELVIDPRKVINFCVVVFCVAAIGVLVYLVYNTYKGTAVPFWEGLGYSALYFVICALSIGTVLLARKPLISIFAAECLDDDTASTASSPDAATANPDAATSPHIRTLYLPGLDSLFSSS